MLVSGMGTGIVSTDETGDTNLGRWLQSLYDGGASAGDFAFIRVNPDLIPAANNRYFEFDTADSGNKPVLTFTTRPPTTILGFQ